MKNRLIFATFFSLFLVPMAFAQTNEVESYRGEIFDLKDNSKKYTLSQTIRKEKDHLITRVVYRDLNKKVALVEEVFSIGDQIQKYIIIQNQIDRKAVVTQTKNKIKFTLTKISDGTLVKSSENKRPTEPLAAGSSMFNLVQQHWVRLQKGKDVDLAIALWDRQEAIDFYLRKVSIENKVMLTKLVPSNFFVRQVVDAIEIKFNIESKQIISYKGRTNLMEKTGKTWDEFDGLIVIKTMEPQRMLSTEKSP